MVKLTHQPYWESPQEISLPAWLSQLPEAYQKSALVAQAAQLAFMTGNEILGLGNISLWQHGLSIADSLLPLNVDAELLSAALLYPIWEHQDISLQDIQETLSPTVAALIQGADQMHAVSDLQQAKSKSSVQVENCRKMLLAMVEDLRVVLLKLAERLHSLRTARFLPEAAAQKLGEEMHSIYAPLANRLGLGQLKWEMEDLAFRAMHPSEYKQLAKQLDMKRKDREALIQQVLQLLNEYLTATQIKNFELMGRAKHLYSIYKKISRKKITLKDLYDISAVRVLVDTIEDCYRVLDIVQQHFEMIPQEFDDYISAPKSNGYQSIHTAVYGPDRHIIEIQIRTHKMHQESELGVAAHWRYKEGGQGNQSYEAKIAWLREVLSWQKEVETPGQNILSDRIYVLTPTGDIIDLPQGATTLDFAYTIHTSVGHRCRGSKINGQIMPLTTPLKMGDRIEVLTGKEAKPSRDWLNPNAGYLVTARAKAKVAHWFRQLDHDQYVLDGKAFLEREIKHLNLHDIDYDELVKKFDYANKEDFYNAIGSGHLRQAQVTGRLEHWYLAPKPVRPREPSKASASNKTTGIIIEGLGNLLSHPARCCNPTERDEIAGYISRQGIAIHKINCASFIARQKLKPEKVLHAKWN
jgi:GTP pyrophosphokinase